MDDVLDRSASVLPPVGFGRHACALVDGELAATTLIKEFVLAGLARGERILYFHGWPPPEALLERLARGADLTDAIARGDLELRAAVEAFASDGPVEPDQVIAVMGEAVGAAEADGRAAPRILVDMTWLLRQPLRPERLVALERAAGRRVAARGASVLCMYDVRCFSPEVLGAVVDAHPSSARPAPSTMEPTFRVTSSEAGVLRLSGELDAAGYDVLDSALAVASAGRDRLTLDLGGLEFIDAGGVNCLLRGARRCGLRLVHAPPSIRRVLDILAVADDPSIEMTPDP